MGHNIKTTGLALCRSPLRWQDSSEPSGHELRTSGAVLWCRWQQILGSCGLWDGASTDRACSVTSCGCLIGLGSREFGGRVNALGSLSCSFSRFWAVVAVWQSTLSCWGRPLPAGNTAAIECICLLCDNVWVGGVCQGGIAGKTLHCNKIINAFHFTCLNVVADRSILYYSWSLYHWSSMCGISFGMSELPHLHYVVPECWCLPIIPMRTISPSPSQHLNGVSVSDDRPGCGKYQQGWDLCDVDSCCVEFRFPLWVKNQQVMHLTAL